MHGTSRFPADTFRFSVTVSNPPVTVASLKRGGSSVYDSPVPMPVSMLKKSRYSEMNSSSRIASADRKTSTDREAFQGDSTTA